MADDAFKEFARSTVAGFRLIEKLLAEHARRAASEKRAPISRLLCDFPFREKSMTQRGPGAGNCILGDVREWSASPLAQSATFTLHKVRYLSWE